MGFKVKISIVALSSLIGVGAFANDNIIAYSDELKLSPTAMANVTLLYSKFQTDASRVYSNISSDTQSNDNTDNAYDWLGSNSYFSLSIEQPSPNTFLRYTFQVGALLGNVNLLEFTLGAKLAASLAMGNIGDAAVTFGYNVGVNYVILNFSNVATDISNVLRPGAGIFGFPSVGLEYYPIEWFGVTAELQIKNYRYTPMSFLEQAVSADTQNTTNQNISRTETVDINIDKIIVVGAKVTF